MNPRLQPVDAAIQGTTLEDESRAIGIYTNILKTLDDTVTELLSPRVHMSMDTRDGPTRAEYALRLNQVQKTRLSVGNAVLRDITAKLQANEADLRAGEDNLRGALRTLDTVANVLAAVAGYITVVCRILAIV
jgi:hypothetical protein